MCVKDEDCYSKKTPGNTCKVRNINQIISQDNVCLCVQNVGANCYFTNLEWETYSLYFSEIIENLKKSSLSP